MDRPTIADRARAAGPHAVAEDGRARRPRRPVGQNSRPPPAARPHGQQVGRRANHADPLRIAVAGQVVVGADGDRDLLEAALRGS